MLAGQHFDFTTGKVLLVIQSHLVRFAGKTILIDACVGEHKSRPLRPEWNLRTGTQYLANLAAAGCTPEDIDIVMCTHLHADHLGWNTRLKSGRWVPTFPNARYVMTQRDIDQRAQDTAQSPQANHGSYQDSVLPVLDAGLVKTAKPGDEIVDGAKDHRLDGPFAGPNSASISTRMLDRGWYFAATPSTARYRFFIPNGIAASALTASKRCERAVRCWNAPSARTCY